MRTLKTLVAALTLALIGMIFAPGAAHAAPAQAQLTINNTPESVGGAAITGAVYTVTKTHTINELTGAQTAVTEAGVDVNAGATTNLDQYAVYSVQQKTRAPGYLLDTRTFTVEFPRLTGGTIDANQSLTINPKLAKVSGTASLLKTANDTTNPVVGATFDVYRTNDFNGTVLDPAVKVNTAALTTGTDGRVTATQLEEGEYYFLETGTVDPYAVNTTKQTFTVGVNAAGTATSTIPEIEFANYTKPSTSTVTKKVNGATTATGSIGQTLTYTIDVDLPADIASYTSYSLTDTFDARFSSVTVKTSPTGITSTATGNVVTMTIDPATATAGVNTIEITAQLNNTTATGASVENTASVTYNNGRGDTGTFSTLAATVTLVEGSITINKFQSDGATALAGATFVLQDAAGNVLQDITGNDLTDETDAQGVIIFDRLPYGTYYVVETVAPANYRLATERTEVTLNADTATQTVSLNNYKYSEALPATGTLGAIPFYVAGAGLLGLFVFFLRRSRREQRTDATA